MATLRFLKRVPLNEFEGNQSWGYNPSFHMALDKYYGTPEAFKILIDACHARGIAVIIDVVYNHAFSQSPIAQLYWDAPNFRPSEDSPFLNVEATHPFNVGYDFNHESSATQTFVDRVTSYWINEYHVDGFRFDLSKGFTQKISTNDGVFRAYDQDRIDVLKLYADRIWQNNPEAYIILEHFAANDEEEVLSDYGMMLWSNHNHNFNEATMGYNSGNKSNFEWIDYKKKGWSKPWQQRFSIRFPVQKCCGNLVKWDTTFLSIDVKTEQSTTIVDYLQNQYDGTTKRNFDVVETSIDVDFSHTGVWYDYIEGNSIDVQNTAQSITLAPGEYHVYLDKEIDSGIISGIEDIENQIIDYKLFPNPGHQNLNINIELDNNSAVNISVYDSNARLVLEKQFDLVQGNNRLNIDISDLNTGIYHIKIKGENFSIIDRAVIKQ